MQAMWPARWRWPTTLVVSTVAIAVGSALVAGAGVQRGTPGEAARLIEVLGLPSEPVVAEIGAGGGDLTVEVARLIGPTGRVYSTELDDRRLADIEHAVARANLSNVTVVQAGERETNLAPACCDAIFMRQVYHHFTDPEAMTRSLAASLRPGGRLAIIDFEPRGFRRFLPATGERGGHGVTPAQLIEEVTRAGFRHTQTIDDWSRGLFLVLFEKHAEPAGAGLP